MAKDEIKDTVDTEEVKKTVKKIEVDEALLRELIESNSKLQESNSRLQGMVDQLGSNAVATNPFQSVTRRNKEEFLQIRKFNDKYFLGYVNMGKPEKPLYIYKEYNPQTRENVEFCNIILDGEKEPLKIEYTTFIRESVLVFVKKKAERVEEEIVTQGVVQKKDFAENGYGMFETMVQVPVEVIYKKKTFTVELEDGRELEVKEEFIA